MSTPEETFQAENKASIARMGADPDFNALTRRWFDESCRHRYSYHFSWMGVPIIQFPQDVVAMQEVIFRVKPDLIIETGIAHGGSLVLYASMLELLGGDGRVLGVDVDIRAHNREKIEKHRMFKRITMFEGSSVSDETAARVRAFAEGKKHILVVLDSNHTHEHVRREIALYAPLVTRGSYLVVFDTAVENMPADSFPDRPWGKGNNPMTAVREFVAQSDRFEIDKEIDKRLLISAAPEGYLKCIKS